MEKWIPSSWKDLQRPPLRWLKMKFSLSPSFCLSTCSSVHVKKRPPGNPQKHSYFHWSTFSTASALDKAPPSLKGPLLGQGRWQILHASSACVLLTERAVEHHMSSNFQCEVKACPTEAPEAPFMPPSPRCPHAQTHWCSFIRVKQAAVLQSQAQTWPGSMQQAVRRMTHGWWQVCNLKASFKK